MIKASELYEMLSGLGTVMTILYGKEAISFTNTGSVPFQRCSQKFLKMVVMSMLVDLKKKQSSVN